MHKMVKILSSVYTEIAQNYVNYVDTAGSTKIT